MTDEEILDTIKASVEATNAMAIFHNQAYCLLANKLGVDIKDLIYDIQSLTPLNDDDFFQTIYSTTKKNLLSCLEQLYQEQSS